MNRVLFVLSVLLMTTMSGLAQDKTAPKGKLIYCSYARNGHAGQGKDYCELIAAVERFFVLWRQKVDQKD